MYKCSPTSVRKTASFSESPGEGKGGDVEGISGGVVGYAVASINTRQAATS